MHDVLDRIRKEKRRADVVVDQFKTFFVFKMLDILQIAGDEIVDADNPETFG